MLVLNRVKYIWYKNDFLCCMLIEIIDYFYCMIIVIIMYLVLLFKIMYYNY